MRAFLVLLENSRLSQEIEEKLQTFLGSRIELTFQTH
jgi:hypothetical protein